MYGREEWTTIKCNENLPLCEFLLSYARVRTLHPTNKDSLSSYQRGCLSYACYFRYITGFKIVAMFPTYITEHDVDNFRHINGIGAKVIAAMQRFMEGKDKSIWDNEEIELLNEEEIEMLSLTASKSSRCLSDRAKP
jgi:hypothetical protein